MPSFKIATSLRRAIFSLLIYRYLCDRIVRRRPRTPRPRCNAPRSHNIICPPTLEEIDTQGSPQNHCAVVTILQWSKRFDATVGLCVHLWRFYYYERLHRRGAIAQSSREDQWTCSFIGLRSPPFTTSAAAGRSLIRTRMPARVVISDIRNLPRPV